MQVTLDMLYKKRVDEGDYYTVSGGLVKRFGEYEFYIKGTNLFDREYEDIPGVPQPGRWLGLGIIWKM